MDLETEQKHYFGCTELIAVVPAKKCLLDSPGQGPQQAQQAPVAPPGLVRDGRNQSLKPFSRAIYR